MKIFEFTVEAEGEEIYNTVVLVQLTEREDCCMELVGSVDGHKLVLMTRHDAAIVRQEIRNLCKRLKEEK